MAKNLLPASMARQVIAKRGKLVAELARLHVDELAVAKTIKGLLTAKRWNAAAGRKDEDWPSRKAGVELMLELMGLRKSFGVEIEDTTPEENRAMGEAVAEVAARKAADGLSPEAVWAWMNTEEGVRQVNAQQRQILAVKKDGE